MSIMKVLPELNSRGTDVDVHVSVAERHSCDLYRTYSVHGQEMCICETVGKTHLSEWFQPTSSARAVSVTES
jgi:hypothetical protein